MSRQAGCLFSPIVIDGNDNNALTIGLYNLYIQKIISYDVLLHDVSKIWNHKITEIKVQGQEGIQLIYES